VRMARLQHDLAIDRAARGPSRARFVLPPRRLSVSSKAHAETPAQRPEGLGAGGTAIRGVRPRTLLEERKSPKTGREQCKSAPSPQREFRNWGHAAASMQHMQPDELGAARAHPDRIGGGGEGSTLWLK
jgi:hypothetical protein